jgi:peptide/nickel transport system permease protein
MTVDADRSPGPGLLHRIWRGDVRRSLWRSPGAVLAIIVLAAWVCASIFAPWVTPHDPFDLARVNLMDASLPPAWQSGGDARFMFGTDNQGRDLLSAIIFGMRLSLLIGVLSIALAATIGVSVGLVAGYAGGILDQMLMRIADVQLSFPAILIALMIDGFARAFLTARRHEELALVVLVMAIGLSKWALFARTVRSSTMVELHKDYVAAARLIGRSKTAIAITHVLPNAMGPLLVIATINLAVAVLTEATLSFLGVGLPPTTPSLGTLIRVGNEYLFSGQWWIAILPGLALVTLIISFNIVGDWLRDIMNPKLR